MKKGFHVNILQYIVLPNCRFDISIRLNYQQLVGFQLPVPLITSSSYCQIHICFGVGNFIIIIMLGILEEESTYHVHWNAGDCSVSIL